MTVALRGAVIIREQNGRLEYRYKCETCGAVQPGTVSTGSVARNVTSRTSFYCTRCKKNQPVELTGN